MKQNIPIKDVNFIYIYAVEKEVWVTITID